MASPGLDSSDGPAPALVLPPPEAGGLLHLEPMSAGSSESGSPPPIFEPAEASFPVLYMHGNNGASSGSAITNDEAASGMPDAAFGSQLGNVPAPTSFGLAAATGGSRRGSYSSGTGSPPPAITGAGAEPDKPPYSFPCMVGMALMSAPSRSMTVCDIYGFMMEHFPYFQTAKAGWKNSVRHNLSLNKYFCKLERSGSADSAKSCVWAVAPGMEQKLARDINNCRQRVEQGLGKGRCGGSGGSAPASPRSVAIRKASKQTSTELHSSSVMRGLSYPQLAPVVPNMAPVGPNTAGLVLPSAHLLQPLRYAAQPQPLSFFSPRSKGASPMMPASVVPTFPDSLFAEFGFEALEPCYLDSVFTLPFSDMTLLASPPSLLKDFHWCASEQQLDKEGLFC
jgi:forkhead box protein N